jgi:hypothetical protein
MTKVRNTIIQSRSHPAGFRRAGLAALARAVLKRVAVFFAGLVSFVPVAQPRLVPVRVPARGGRMPGARCSMR